MIAQELQSQLAQGDLGVFEEIVAVGPYVNACFDAKKLAQSVLTEIQEKKSDFGSGESLEKTILLEGRAPNTHKSVHI